MGAKIISWRTVTVAVIVILFLVGGVVLAAGDKGGDTSTKVAQKQGAKDDSEPAAEVKGSTVAAPNQVESATSNTASPSQPAAKPQAKKPAPQAAEQVVVPPQTPQAPPTQEPVDPPVEEPEEDYIVVAAGGASESYFLETDDGSSVRWYSCNLGAVTSDDELPEKSAFKVYLVIETAVIDENGLVPAPSVTFHVRATADAPLGLLENTGEDYMGSLSLSFCVADEDYNILQFIPIPVMVVAGTPQD